MSYLLPPDEPRTRRCDYCNGDCIMPNGTLCRKCNGDGEIIEEDPRDYFDEVKADDERHPEQELKNKNDE